MFFTFWHDGKFNISSFKSAIVLAGFLHQQFCFLRRKISFFHFDCKQIGGYPLIQPRLCTHAKRRWCRINNKSRSSRKTKAKTKKKPQKKGIVPDEPCQIPLTETTCTWDHEGFSENRSVLPISLLVDNQVETIAVWNVKKSAKLWENLSFLVKAMDVEVTSKALANLPNL